MGDLRKAASDLTPGLLLDLLPDLLPDLFQDWFETHGWQIYPHQQEMLVHAHHDKSCLMIAPTGAGKTLSGFLPSLIDLHQNPQTGLHSLYISPLKALAEDIARNLEKPAQEMGLGLTIETRTGDTKTAQRNRQRQTPPQILLTTPESLELMLAWPEATTLFSGLKTIILDEIHALIGTKRGDLLSLSVAGLRRLAPQARIVGLSATIADASQITPYLSETPDRVEIVKPDLNKKLSLDILQRDDLEMPWAGHSAAYAVPDIYQLIESHKMVLVFVNTRAQAELLFQALWHINDKNLRIGLHHGSLDSAQRKKVEAAMAAGGLDGVVATSSLDLGIDWADIDLVIQVGAPKGTARLVQRVGRAGHRLDATSKAIMIPGNRFEMLEVIAARQNVRAQKLDRLPEHRGALDVLAQHIVGRAISGPFFADNLYEQIKTAPPYHNLSRAEFDEVLDFVSTGGYALKHYSQFQRLVCGVDGAWRLTSRQVATRWRMNVGTIVESGTLKVRVKGGPVLGEVEEYFVQGLVSGDSFIFAGRMLEYVGMKGMVVECRPTVSTEPKVPAYAGGRLPLSVNMAETVREILQDPDIQQYLPNQIKNWLAIQKQRSRLPDTKSLLVENFPRGPKHYLVAYCFEGRNAHQTLGMLLTKRMERAGYQPLGFVATDYAIAIWSLKPADDIDKLLSADMLGDDLEEWMAESSMLKRSFRQVATIAGLIDKKSPGMEKNTRQVTINTDLIYDVLRQHQPDHMLLKATQEDAARGLTDIRRLSDMLTRFSGHIDHRKLSRITPLAVPLMLEVGRESVTASGVEAMLDDLQNELLNEMLP